MRRKICVVTGSRAEYGLLRWVMEDIKNSQNLDLQIIVTGMHLSPEFGLTYEDIEGDGFTINRKVEMLLSSDSSQGLAKSMGLGLIGFGESLQQLQPDIMLVLGDRFEIFSIRAEVGQYLPDWRPDSDYRQTVSAQKKFGGGGLVGAQS